MFTRTRGIKNLPGMHCDHVLQDKRRDRTRQDKVKLITELVFSFFISTNNGQQEAIDWNIDLWSRLRWFNFKSARFAVFETSGISGHADVWRPVCCGTEGLYVNILLFPNWSQHPCSHTFKWNTHSNLFWPEIEVFNLRAAWNEDFSHF